MIDQILQTLYEQGPLELQELANAMECDHLEICEPVADLVIDKRVHLDLDGTIWFAGEIAA